MTLQAEQVAVRYAARVAVQPTSLRLQPGELIALVGPNGAGKSSLLKALAGLVPRSGCVTWNGADLQPLNPRQRARTIAYLPQAPVAHWPLRARELVALGRLPHRALGEAETAEDRDAIAAAIEQTQIGPLADRSVDELSVGERARVLLARALAVRAPALLVDEPIASLDPYHQLQIMTVLRAFASETALVIAVLHDLQLAARFCSRIVLMHDGAVVADGAADDVLSDATLQRYYRVEAYLGRHDGRPLIVPWRRVG